MLANPRQISDTLQCQRKRYSVQSVNILRYLNIIDGITFSNVNILRYFIEEESEIRSDDDDIDVIFVALNKNPIVEQSHVTSDQFYYKSHAHYSKIDQFWLLKWNLRCLIFFIWNIDLLKREFPSLRRITCEKYSETLCH